MITQTRTCDKCSCGIPPELYNHSHKINVRIGHHGSSGITLEFCKDCWTQLYAIYAPAPPKEDATPQPTHNERVISLIAELVELLTPQQ